MVKGFEDIWGCPQCAGAIDESHIPIQAPSECPKDYYNRKGCHSILQQGLVSHQYCFVDINVGWPGSVDDARVLANSEVFKKGQNGALLPQQPKLITGVSVPLLIVGDPAYLLLSWIMKQLLAPENQERERPNFKYGCLQLNRSRCPMVRNYSIKSSPVDRLGQYLNSACSHHSQFTSVQLTSVEYFS